MLPKRSTVADATSNINVIAFKNNVTVSDVTVHDGSARRVGSVTSPRSSNTAEVTVAFVADTYPEGGGDALTRPIALIINPIYLIVAGAIIGVLLCVGVTIAGVLCRRGAASHRAEYPRGHIKPSEGSLGEIRLIGCEPTTQLTQLESHYLQMPPLPMPPQPRECQFGQNTVSKFSTYEGVSSTFNWSRSDGKSLVEVDDDNFYNEIQDESVNPYEELKQPDSNCYDEIVHDDDTCKEQVAEHKYLSLSL